jgi:sigma-B regulation protein RsbU (phosphoserine phosphatase)
LDVAWLFEPCQKIGGDIFNLMRLGGHRWAIYMLDVSGHGVPAAMVAVSVSQIIQQLHEFTHVDPASPPNAPVNLSPAETLEVLDQAFPFEPFNNFFTMNFFILDLANGCLNFSNAGHPHPFLLRGGGKLERLSTAGLAIGIRSLHPGGAMQHPFQNENIFIQPGDKLIIYTDGVTEYQNEKNELYGDERFYRIILQYKDQAIHQIVKAIETDLKTFGSDIEPLDDITLLGIDFKQLPSQ